MISKLHRLILTSRLGLQAISCTSFMPMQQSRTITTFTDSQPYKSFAGLRDESAKRRLHTISSINHGDEEILVEEDYLEEEDETEPHQSDPLLKEQNPKSYIKPEEVVKFLENQLAKNVELVECDSPQSPYKYLVIASPYNDRHGDALIEKARRHFCKRDYFGIKNPVKRVNSNGWYILDFQVGILHIMNEELREKYNLAQIWTEENSETYEDISLIPPSKVENVKKAKAGRVKGFEKNDKRIIV